MNSKKETVAAYRRARQTFLEAIDGLTDEDYLRPGAAGYWSVKDIMAHLTAWESELITALAAIKNKQKNTPRLVLIDDIDEWNEEQYHISVSRPLEIIKEDFLSLPKHLIAAIETLDDKTLTDNRIFHWMEGEPLTYLIYENAIWHEEEHAEDIVDWRRSVEDGDESAPDE